MKREELLSSANVRLVEQGNLDTIKEAFSAGYIAHAGDRTYRGHEFLRRYTKQIRTAIPDIKLRKMEFLVRAGTTVTWQRTLCGTHKSEMMGIPPSGKKVEWTELVVSHFDGKMIAEEWVVSELAGRLLLKLPTTK